MGRDHPRRFRADRNDRSDRQRARRTGATRLDGRPLPGYEVVLLDADGRILQNSNNSGALLGMPDELAQPGSSHQEILRFLYRRGDFGFEQDEDSFVADRRARILAAGRCSFSERMPDGRWAEYNFRPLADGKLLVMVRDVTELRDGDGRLGATRRRLHRRHRVHYSLSSSQL